MRNMMLVFRRDYLGYISAWGFWLGLLSLPLLMVAGAFFSIMASNSSPVRYYSVIETNGTYAAAIDADLGSGPFDAATLAAMPPEVAAQAASAAQESRKFIEVPAPARSIDDLRPYLLGEKMVDGPDGPKPLFAAIIASDTANTVEYWSEDVSIEGLRNALRAAVRDTSRARALAAAGLPDTFLKTIDADAPEIQQKRIRQIAEQAAAGSDVTAADQAPRFAALGLAYLLWLMIFSVIQYLLMGTIEERSNKIFDTLLTSVTLPQLLAGKLFAVFAVTLTMMTAWGLTAAIASMFAASLIPGGIGFVAPFLAPLVSPGLLIPAFLCLVLGYLMYGCIFMALGSLCDTIQEAQTLLSPLMILLMLPMLGMFMAFNDPGSPLISIASWIPLFTPFLLILRIPQDPPLWELVAQIGLMALTTLIVLWLATKVYRAGAVHGAGVGDVGGLFKRLVPFGKKS